MKNKRGSKKRPKRCINSQLTRFGDDKLTWGEQSLLTKVLLKSLKTEHEDRQKQRTRTLRSGTKLTKCNNKCNCHNRYHTESQNNSGSKPHRKYVDRPNSPLIEKTSPRKRHKSITKVTLGTYKNLPHTEDFIKFLTYRDTDFSIDNLQFFESLEEKQNRLDFVCHCTRPSENLPITDLVSDLFSMRHCPLVCSSTTEDAVMKTKPENTTSEILHESTINPVLKDEVSPAVSFNSGKDYSPKRISKRKTKRNLTPQIKREYSTKTKQLKNNARRSLSYDSPNNYKITVVPCNLSGSHCCAKACSRQMSSIGTQT